MRSFRNIMRLSRLLAVLTATILSSSAAAAFGADGPEGGGQPVVSGYLSLRSVIRTAVSASHDVFRDQDLFGELRLDASNVSSGLLELHFLGASRYDIDGKSDVRTFDPLEDLGNTRTGDGLTQIYEANIGINGLFTGLSQVRLGRQAGTREEHVFFDGVAADLRPARFLAFTVYGGLPVTYFEVDGKEGRDRLAGAGMDVTAGASTGISFDYLTVLDDRTYLDDRDVTDRLLSFKLWQRFTKNIKATARMRYQNGESRDLNVRLLGALPESGAEIGATYVRQFREQTEQTNVLSPLFDVLGASQPYQSVDVRARKFLGERFAVDLGYFQRSLLKSNATDTAFNREYSRASAGIQVTGFVFDDLSLLLTGERWRSEEQGFYSGGADLTYAFGRGGKAGSLSAGTYYSLYKYDQEAPARDEHERVRTYYVNGRVAVLRQLSLTAAYERERSIERYQTARVGVRYDF
jgi:hypothetical protein